MPNLFEHFRTKVPSNVVQSTIATPHFVPLGQRISERNTKEKLVFLFIPEREELRQGQSYEKSL